MAIGDDPRVTLYHSGVGDIDGLKPFNASTGKAGHMDDWDHSGSYHKPTGHLEQSPEIKFKPPEPMPCIRLDTWRNINPSTRGIDFAWVDIQGSQRDFIEGGRLTLAITKYLYIECHHTPLYEDEPTQDELMCLLPGFEPLGIYGLDNILLKNRHNL